MEDIVRTANKKFTLRCTEYEFEQLSKKANHANLALSHYLIQCGLSDNIPLSSYLLNNIEQIKFESALLQHHLDLLLNKKSYIEQLASLGELNNLISFLSFSAKSLHDIFLANSNQNETNHNNCANCHLLNNSPLNSHQLNNDLLNSSQENNQILTSISSSDSLSNDTLSSNSSNNSHNSDKASNPFNASGDDGLKYTDMDHKIDINHKNIAHTYISSISSIDDFLVSPNNKSLIRFFCNFNIANLNNSFSSYSPISLTSYYFYIDEFVVVLAFCSSPTYLSFSSFHFKDLKSCPTGYNSISTDSADILSDLISLVEIDSISANLISSVLNSLKIFFLNN